MNDIQKQALVKMFKNSELFDAITREFDRSFVITIDENRAGKLVVAVEEQDSGNNVMTVADVAAFLQTDRASVRRMTGDRAQSVTPSDSVRQNRRQDDSFLQTRY